MLSNERGFYSVLAPKQARIINAFFDYPKLIQSASLDFSQVS